MKIGFAGLWHLGTVMSAVFASAGHDVIAFDEPSVIEPLRALELPVAEPGLRTLVADEVRAGRLRFSANRADLGDRELLWITYDTPLRDDGSADAAFVIDRATALLTALQHGTLVVVSSQVPVGSTATLERRAVESMPGGGLRFACSPENLRLGKAISYMRNVDRYVIGVRTERDAATLRAALAPLSPNVEVMSVESAEVTKHAVNAFLATSVAFINELAGLCERTGADAREVERGLKTDMRIGEQAYLRAGGPFAGGTLARDINFVIEEERKLGLQPLLFQGVRDANVFHASWLQRRFAEAVGEPRGRALAILGLTYKAGTNTLRGSNAVMLARWFAGEGGRVCAFDPAVRSLPDDVRDCISLAPSVDDALHDADAALIATEWPEFRKIAAETFHRELRMPVIFDPGRFLEEKIRDDDRLRYYAVGLAG